MNSVSTLLFEVTQVSSTGTQVDQSAAKLFLWDRSGRSSVVRILKSATTRTYFLNWFYDFGDLFSKFLSLSKHLQTLIIWHFTPDINFIKNHITVTHVKLNNLGNFAFECLLLRIVECLICYFHRVKVGCDIHFITKA